MSSMRDFSPFRVSLKKFGRLNSCSGLCWMRHLPLVWKRSKIALCTAIFISSFHCYSSTPPALKVGGVYQKLTLTPMGSRTIVNFSGCCLIFIVMYLALSMAPFAIYLKPWIPCFFMDSHSLRPSGRLPQLNVLSPISYFEYSDSWKRYSAPDVFDIWRALGLPFVSRAAH